MGLRVALSAKLREGKLAIVDNLHAESFKTKELNALLKEKNWDNVLFVHGKKYFIKN